MKKDLIVHFTFATAFFAAITLLQGWFDISYLSFWLGAVLGTVLPDADHLFYVYLLRPQEATSKEAVSLMSERKLLKTWDLLASTRTQRINLLFHSAHFQLIFLIFAIWIITSSQSLLGKGIVLAFMLHLLIDQVMDLMETKNIDHWFTKLPVNLDYDQKRLFMFVNGVLILIFGILL